MGPVVSGLPPICRERQIDDFLPLGEQKENLGQIREYRRWLVGYETAGFICLIAVFILLTGLSNIIMGIDGR